MAIKKTKQLAVGINVPTFPNMVQTYILSPIVALIKRGVHTTIISENIGDCKKLPAAITQYNLLEKTVYVRPDYIHIPQELLSLPLHNKKYRSTITALFKSKLWKRFGWRYFIRALIRAKSLAFANFDIMHSHTLTTTYDYLFMKEVCSIPVITTFHGMEPRTSSNLPKEKAQAVFASGTAFLVNTEFAKNQLINIGCPPEKIVILPQGTNLEDFPFSERSISSQSTIKLMTVGRLSIEKGHHIAIRAVSRLIKTFPNIEYHIIGDGPEKTELSNLISKLNLNKYVTLHGLVTTEELKSHYTNAHIFILPSINTTDGYHVETQGVVLQEAQASGIPVIASKTGGIPEVIINDNTGLLFEESNDENLAQQIESLITDKDLYQALSVQARKDVEENYSIEVICNRLLNVYQKSLQNN